MQTKSHRLFLILLTVIVVSSSAFYSCDEKDAGNLPPTITLLGTVGSITGDVTAEMGDTLHFHLRAKQGTDKLLTFLIKVNGQIVKDSTFSSEGFELHLDMIKGADSLEVFEFIVRDRKSREATIAVNATLAGRSGYGSIARHEDMELHGWSKRRGYDNI